jgi:hypothetical protein
MPNAYSRENLAYWELETRLSCFFKTKYCFYSTNDQLKPEKMGTQLYAEPSLVQYSLLTVVYPEEVLGGSPI